MKCFQDVGKLRELLWVWIEFKELPVASALLNIFQG